ARKLPSMFGATATGALIRVLIVVVGAVASSPPGLVRRQPVAVNARKQTRSKAKNFRDNIFLNTSKNYAPEFDFICGALPAILKAHLLNVKFCAGKQGRVNCMTKCR